MKKSLFFLTLYCFTCSVFAQHKKEYAASLIPDSLKKDALAVTREELVNLVIKKPGKGRQEVKSVITILNEKGKQYQYFQEEYDRFQKLEDIEINSYDAEGYFMKRYKKRDLEKAASDDGISIVTDNKVMYGFINTEKYPFTIEFNYTIKYDGIIDYNDFFPSLPDVSTQRSVYAITAETSNKVRFKSYKCNLAPKMEIIGDVTHYRFEVVNVKPAAYEVHAAKRDIPHVKIAPSSFEMDDLVGDMSTWQGFGKWISALNKQSIHLNEDRADYFRSMVKDAVTEKDKIAILYNYLQENFRYVSIQLGIGGLKPFPADFVDKKKYGDCKALSNFMRAMLNVVNIKSYYSIINAGSDQLPVDKDFSQNSFNHVILCVPQVKDTIWLECTSRTQPFGKLGPFTENRNAFLITETGGVMVETPRSNPEDHSIHSFSTLQLLEDGSGMAVVEMKHGGNYTELLNANLFESNENEKNDFLFNQFGLKQPDEIKIKKKDVSGRNYTAHLEMKYEKLPDFSAGSKHFLSPRIYRFWNLALPKNEKRLTDYYLDFPRIKIDTTIINLPEGYRVETLPKATRIKSEMGEYESNYQFDEMKRQLMTSCRIRVKNHIIASSKYNQAAKFFSDILTEQQQKIVVMKTN